MNLDRALQFGIDAIRKAHSESDGKPPMDEVSAIQVLLAAKTRPKIPFGLSTYGRLGRECEKTPASCGKPYSSPGNYHKNPGCHCGDIPRGIY